MSVAAAVAPAAAVIDATTPVVLPPLPRLVAVPTVVAAATVPPPTARHPRRPAARPHRPMRPSHRHAAGRRREARIYSWASRSFLSVDPSSETVVLSRHGNSVYGTLRPLNLYVR